MQQNTNGLGDIHSTEMGTGARYNTGKIPVELLPLRDLYMLYVEEYVPETEEESSALSCLKEVAAFQEGDDAALRRAMLSLGDTESVMTQAALVFDYGRKKYAEWNWAKGMKWSAVIGCAVRHLMRILDGEDIDEVEKGGSGLSHVGHVMCNLLMLSTYRRVYPEGDDRPMYLKYKPVKDIHDDIHDTRDTDSVSITIKGDVTLMGHVHSPMQS